MEDFVNVALYFVACVCVLVPVFGLGLAPGIVINLELSAILSNLYSQIAEKGLIRGLIKEKGSLFPIKTLVPALESIQSKIDSIESKEEKKK